MAFALHGLIRYYASQHVNDPAARQLAVISYVLEIVAAGLETFVHKTSNVQSFVGATVVCTSLAEGVRPSHRGPLSLTRVPPAPPARDAHHGRYGVAGSAMAYWLQLQ